MVHVQRISTPTFHRYFTDIVDLLQLSITKSGNGDLENLLKMAADPNNLLLGIFNGLELHGITLITPMANSLTRDVAAIWQVIALRPSVSLKLIYDKLINAVLAWCRQNGIKVLVGMTPREQLYSIAKKLDDRWRIQQLIVMEVSY